VRPQRYSFLFRPRVLLRKLTKTYHRTCAKDRISIAALVTCDARVDALQGVGITNHQYFSAVAALLISLDCFSNPICILIWHRVSRLATLGDAKINFRRLFIRRRNDWYLEGLMSKRRDRPYQAGRSKHWLKIKNRAHPEMSRGEEWARASEGE
jgi:hypothetical protein